MTSKIRNARSEDATLLCDAEKFWAQKPGYLVSQPSELKAELFAQRIQELSNNPKGLYVVAMSNDGDIIGHALLDPMGLQSISHIVRLTIVLHPGFEGKGTGKTLVQHLVRWAKAADGIEKIELLVRANNERATALYKKFGFVEEGRLRKRIKTSDGKYIDDVSMALEVK